METIGQKMSQVLKEIEETLWEFEANTPQPPQYTDDGFKAAIKIFTSALMDKVWILQEDEKVVMDDRLKMVTKLGQDVRKLVKTYTNIDTHELYQNHKDLPACEHIWTGKEVRDKWCFKCGLMYDEFKTGT